ncbi:GAF domain containing [Cryptosporidium sp. chipmunk genotype I]|uniref:GAF domain containing n=1 Tax=Cryptosporidium sp. chipmunk genotype I TaxID=1280935 RepID=UPI003519F4B7|nr:GAF domain containing [Cryptosporidium sp. chipmunk genotype I]
MLNISKLKEILSWDDIYNLFESSLIISSNLDPKLLVNTILCECRKVINCKDCNLFIYDSINDVFYHGFDTSKYIISDSLLKKVLIAKKYEVLDSSGDSDSYQLENGHDIKTRRFSNNAIYLPIYNAEKESPIAVLEILDKFKLDKDGVEVKDSFSKIDIVKLSCLSRIFSISVINCEKYREVRNTKEKADNLLNLVQSLRPDLGLQSNLFTLCIHAQEIIESEHCIALIGIPERQQIISLISDTGNELLFNYEIGDIIHRIIETRHSLIIQNTGDDNEPHFENRLVECSCSSIRIVIGSSSVSMNNDDQFIRLLQKVYGGERPIYNALVFPIYAERDNWSCIPTPSQRVSSISSLSSAFSSFEIGHDYEDLASVSPRNNSILNSSIISSSVVAPGSPKSDRVGRSSLATQPHTNVRSSSLSPSNQFVQSSNTQAISLIVLINRLGVFKEKSKFTENDVRLLEPFGRIVAPNIGTLFQTSLFSYLQTIYNTDRNISFNKYQDKMPLDPPSFAFPHSNWKNRHSDIIFEEDEDGAKDLEK